jgi:hypothetical protein
MSQNRRTQRAGDDDADTIVAEVVDTTTLSAITQAEIDSQIATAKRYPRSIRRFMDEATEMVTLSEEIAGECMYALPRGGKTIEGPSARFAEIVASSWGNCRAGARIVSEEEKFIVAQGVFHDLERNVAITYEVKRRITDKYGNRYNDDMVGTTGNAACSISLRNAVLKGVPKAFWKSLYDEARKCAIGDVKTLPNKRATMLAAFAKMGVTEDMVLSSMEAKGIEDIGLDELATLRGLFQAIKDGDTTVEQAFQSAPQGGKVKDSGLNSKLKEKKASPPSNGDGHDDADVFTEAAPTEEPDETTAEQAGDIAESSPGENGFRPHEGEDPTAYHRRIVGEIGRAMDAETLGAIQSAINDAESTGYLKGMRSKDLSKKADDRYAEITK